MWIRILLHGKAAARPEIRDAVQQTRDRGHQVDVRVTWEQGDNDRLTREALHDGVETLVAGGGDGTINEVVAAIVRATTDADERPSFGILPLGTANDFARSCSIPLEPTAALDTVVSNEPTPVDVAKVGERILVNVATGGFGPKITVATSEDLKKLLGGAAYFVTALTKLGTFTPDHARFRGPGFEWSGSYAVLAIGNGRQAGGGNILCPEALIDDALLDVRILPQVPAEERAQALQKLLAEGEAAIEKSVVKARVPWVEIESAEPLHINLDGEPMIARQFHFEVDPGGLGLHLPRNAPVLKA